jgi:hypothetical protein
MRKIVLVFTLFLLVSAYLFPQITIKNQTEEFIEIELNFSDQYSSRDTIIDGILYKIISGEGDLLRIKGDPWLPEYNFSIGIPMDANPRITSSGKEQLTYNNINILPVPENDPVFFPVDVKNANQEVYSQNGLYPQLTASLNETYIMRYARILTISAAPFQYNPVTRELIFNNRIELKVHYNRNFTSSSYIEDAFTDDYLQSAVINPEQAGRFKSVLNTSSSVDHDYWYNPAKVWHKIYVRNKGVYRVSFDYLKEAGVDLGNGVSSNKLILYNEGKKVPIDIVDKDDSVFNPGDYFQFVGFPPAPSEYTKLNIYNKSNVYWFTYESDEEPLLYKSKSGYPRVWDRTVQNTLTTIHFEKDSLFERLGYAPNGNRDYWYWGRAEKRGTVMQGFQERFNVFKDLNLDHSRKVTVRVNMHGLTTSNSCPEDHKADIEITGQPIGSIVWDGQNAATFEKQFHVSDDSIKIYPTGNNLTVWLRGNNCGSFNDEIRVNWFEFDYWRFNRTAGQPFDFMNPEPYKGINRYWLFGWTHDNMKIYIPDRSTMFADAQIVGDDNKSVLFVDTVSAQYEYFCVASTQFLIPDSIRRDIPSDLRSIANGADYLIIAHRKFTKIAEDLAQFRSSSFPDKSIPDPRVKIAYIDEIYDEFSHGMLNPFAVKDFVKHTFNSWVKPAPAYVVLVGDMSYDYRKLLPGSRENYIPSIPYHSEEYGQAASDNMFVAVAGTDATPDMAIGRLSIETVAEGEILLDKLRNYPGDNSKEWKQNVLLLASGLNEADENKFGFNDASMQLNNNFLTRNGIASTKIFRYPNRPEYIPFKGEGPQIRKGFNDGAVLVNYYGHGGGYQWDLTFLNDDIYLLENGARLPVISSVTCYTAHFDNQDVFGEQFIKVPGKGAIGFWGSSGVTLWGIGNYINELFFREVFNNKEYIIGKAILKAKRQIPSTGYYTSQIALLTYLGDPVMKMAIPDLPDFTVKSGDISIFPDQPLANDTILVKVNLRNLGITLFGDSLTVELTAESIDTGYVVEKRRIVSFGEYHTLEFIWIPDQGGLYQLTVMLNETEVIQEMDYTDNSASASFAVFDLSEPKTIKPLNGYAASGNVVEFLISDIGHFLDLDLAYVIEIDSAPSFNSPGKISANVLPQNGIARWVSPELNYSPGFWRSRIVQDGDSSRWSPPGFFTLNKNIDGYYADGKAMSSFNKYNLVYSEKDSALVLNTDKLPPKPENSRYLEEFTVPAEVTSEIKLTAFTSDRTYYYLGNIWYYSLNLQNNPQGKSFIYKVGTGNNGTVKGRYYGKVPGFYDKILNQFFWHSDGNLYVATGNPYYLRRINLQTEQIDSVFIPEGMIDWETARPRNGAYYLYSDGNLVYNISLYDSLGNKKYILRTFDPGNDWNRTRPDIALHGTSYGTDFCSFFVFGEHLYTYENYNSGFMRRYRLDDGFYEEEWITYLPFQGFYSWIADKQSNRLHATVFSGSKTPKIFTFVANYIDAHGYITLTEAGPASEWKKVSYNIVNNSSGGIFGCDLLGYNKTNKEWDTLFVNFSNDLDISSVSADTYPMVKVNFKMSDSSFEVIEPIKLKDVHIEFVSLPEIQISNKSLSFNPDSVLQGLTTSLNMNISNIGFSRADDIKVSFYLNDDDSVFYSKIISIDNDSSTSVQHEFNTAFLSPATLHKMQVNVVYDKPEFYTFNNIARNSFLVARDSINPLFRLTFDGKEIINGDIVSAKPEIIISLKDNGPLPLKEEDFTLVLDGRLVLPDTAGINYEYIPYPNSEAVLTWNPVLKDGRHTVEVLAKDASGNFFDSTSAKFIFYVFNTFDLANVYNYPNPFEGETHFTFELRGDDKQMEEFYIKVYTIAGRLIKDIRIDPLTLKAGFNRIHWDGRDQDGNEIANGVYLYKIISRNSGITKTVLQKLARIR